MNLEALRAAFDASTGARPKSKRPRNARISKYRTAIPMDIIVDLFYVLFRGKHLWSFKGVQKF
jgi:hypothetical protein